MNHQKFMEFYTKKEGRIVTTCHESRECLKNKTLETLKFGTKIKKKEN